jgi:hypothetical protein
VRFRLAEQASPGGRNSATDSGRTRELKPVGAGRSFYNVMLKRTVKQLITAVDEILSAYVPKIIDISTSVYGVTLQLSRIVRQLLKTIVCDHPPEN